MSDTVRLRHVTLYTYEPHMELELGDDERIVNVETAGLQKTVWIANDRYREYQTAKLAADDALLDCDFSRICGY